jgi:glycosyltransferase involved in cell wall biosynthesis
MPMRKLTVIVPVYNAARTIGRCVDSILAGAPGDLELILVDDGSADGSGGICDARAAADGRVRALHQPNGGVSAARNRGLAEATGEFVAFADADDAVLPGFLPGALALMERFDADLVVGGVREIFRARAFVNAARVYEPLLCEGAAKDSFCSA